ncbi:hypothetical protein ACFQ1M_13640 [Sungkyunkwania multivorans]|uniref:Uncharacterized protein n=1 Tax=Sungkyunkwania multivorans TaxID=1173618 RepID=A0ABW3D2M2_9FLAO
MAQELKGKWLLMTHISTMSIPAVPITEFTDNLLIMHDFTEKIGEVSYRAEGSRILGTNVDMEFNFVNNHQIEFFIKGKRNNTPEIIKELRLKLLPTKGDVDPAFIEEQTYEIDIFGKLQLLEFKKDLSKSPVQLDRLNFCSKFKLEKFDQTWFVVLYYDNDLRKYVFPIKEMNENWLLIYYDNGTGLGWHKMYSVVSKH